MKKVLFLFFTALLYLILPAYGEDLLPFYEEIMETSHNIVPKGEIPSSPHQICQICHTAEDVRSYLGTSSPTPPELAAIFESPHQMEGGSLKAIWNPSDSKISYLPSHAQAMKKEPSASCLSCHDGVIGNDIHGMIETSGKFTDHPVNVPYPRESDGRFVPALPLPNELRYWSIPNQNENGITLPTGPTSEYYPKQTPPLLSVRTTYGKVNCGSCHNPHSSKISAYLRESPKTLCLVCHIR